LPGQGGKTAQKKKLPRRKIWQKIDIFRAASSSWQNSCSATRQDKKIFPQRAFFGPFNLVRKWRYTLLAIYTTILSRTFSPSKSKQQQLQQLYKKRKKRRTTMTFVTASEVLVEGNTAVITGASSGIGRAAAVECASRGMNVWMVDIDEDDLKVALELVQSKCKTTTTTTTTTTTSGKQVRFMVEVVVVKWWIFFSWDFSSRISHTILLVLFLCLLFYSSIFFFDSEHSSSCG
jgi:short chain dehydrogenase